MWTSYTIIQIFKQILLNLVKYVSSVCTYQYTPTYTYYSTQILFKQMESFSNLISRVHTHPSHLHPVNHPQLGYSKYNLDLASFKTPLSQNILIQRRPNGPPLCMGEIYCNYLPKRILYVYAYIIIFIICF